jgi:hypothetical protein
VAKIKETYTSELPPATDGVIRGAKLLGLTSRNGRRYEGKGLDAAKGLYEGRKVYVNHPKPDGMGAERPFGDWAGVIENVQYRKGEGLYGDVVLRQESAYFKGIVEVASNPKFRKSCGFSHVAEGESHFDGDTEIIESIKEVFSVDLVTDPATTAGIFESVKTFRQVVESLPDSHAPLRKRLIEMMDAGFMGGDFSLHSGGEDKEQPTDQMSQLTAIVRDTIAALADVSKALAKASKPDPVIPPVAGDKPAADKPFPPKGEDEESEDEEMKPEDKEKIAAFESLSRENAELKASKLLLESGRQATDIRMKALANCATDEEQKELLESWPKIEDDGRPRRSAPLLTESDSDFPRDNPEKFAALLR